MGQPTPDEIEQAVGSFRTKVPNASPKDEEDYARFFIQERMKDAVRPGLERDIETAQAGIRAGALGPNYKDAIKLTRQRLGKNEARNVIGLSQATSGETFSQARSAVSGLRREVGKVVDPIKRGEYTEALTEAAGIPLRAAATTLQSALDVVDTPDRVYREQFNAAKQGRESQLGKAWSKDGDAGDFERYYKDIKDLIPEGARGPISDVGSAIAGGLFTLQSGQPARPEIRALASEQLGKLAAGFAQPSTLVTLGLGGTSKTALQQALRFLPKSPTGRNAAKLIAAAYEQKGATGELADLVKNITTSAGGDLSRMAKIIGPEAEYLGKAGVKVAGVDLGAVAGRLGLPEQATRRGIEKVVRKGVSKLPTQLRGAGSIDAPYHTRKAFKRGAAGMKHAALAEMQDFYDQFAKDVAPKAAGISKLRQEELVREYFDPAVEHVAGAWQRKTTGGAFPLTQQEQEFADALEKFFNNVSGGKGSVNPVTGRYVPRQYASKRNRLVNTRSIFQGESDEFARANPRKKRGHNKMISVAGPSGPMKVRHPGVPLGETFAKGDKKANYDPFQIAANYSSRVAYQNARKQFENFLGDNFQVAGKSSGLNKLSRVKNSAGQNVRIPAELLREGGSVFNGFTIPIYDAAMNNFKVVNLLPYPRFHALNMVEDVTKMISAGFSKPESFDWVRKINSDAVPDTAVLFLTPQGNPITKGQAKQALRESGIGQSYHAGAYDFSAQTSPRDAALQFEKARDKAEIPGLLNAPRRIGRAVKRAPLKAGNEAFLDTVTAGTRRLGRKWAEGWERYSKGAMFLDQMAKGVPVNEAADRTIKFLFDHAIQSSAQQALRRVSPFIGYTMRTAGLTPHLLKNPKVALAPRKIQQAFNDNEQGDTAPEHMRNRYPTIQAGSGVRELISSGASEINKVLPEVGGEINPGYGMAIGVRGSPLEGAMPLLSGATGNDDSASLGAGPVGQYLYERASKKDMLTGKELEPSEGGPLGLFTEKQFNYGTPGVPESMWAKQGQVAPLARYGAGFLGPAPTMAANIAAQHFGSTGPVLGATRDWAENQPIRNYLQGLSLMGVPVGLTTPLTEYDDAARSQPVKSTAKLKGEAKKRRIKKAKERRK